MNIHIHKKKNIIENATTLAYNKAILPTININKENVSGPLPQPNVKIIDLQHNLMPFDGSHAAINAGNHIISGGGIRMDSQSLRNQIKLSKKEVIQMSLH